MSSRESRVNGGPNGNVGMAVLGTGTDLSANGGGGRAAAGRRGQSFKISYGGVFSEWLTATISVGLLSFYTFALLSSPSSETGSPLYKLLAAYVIMSSYMRLCFVLYTASKTYVLFKLGPVETHVLPMQREINIISSLMFLVEPGHFICLCWITHEAFPMRQCPSLNYWATCTSLHICSTIFVAMWIFTGMAIGCLIILMAVWERGRVNVHNPLQLAPIPDQLRQRIVASLPLSADGPEDEDPCAICFDRSEGPEQWRVLPCGHRFHPHCVDDWLVKQGGSCPTCRHDPTRDYLTTNSVSNNTTEGDPTVSSAGREPARPNSSGSQGTSMGANSSEPQHVTVQVPWSPNSNAETSGLDAQEDRNSDNFV